MNQPAKLSKTGITGWRRVTASDLRTSTENSRCWAAEKGENAITKNTILATGIWDSLLRASIRLNRGNLEIKRATDAVYFYPLATKHWPLSSLPPLLLDLDAQALDLLVQGGQRNAELLGGFGLVPAAFFQHVGDDAPLAVFHDLKQRRIRTMVHERELGAAPHHVVGQ